MAPVEPLPTHAYRLPANPCHELRPFPTNVTNLAPQRPMSRVAHFPAPPVLHLPTATRHSHHEYRTPETHVTTGAPPCSSHDVPSLSLLDRHVTKSARFGISCRLHPCTIRDLAKIPSCDKIRDLSQLYFHHLQCLAFTPIHYALFTS